MRQADDQHHHVTLAHSEGGHIVVCSGCGALQLRFGELTLHLDAERFQRLGALLAAAQRQFEQLSAAHPEHPAFASAADPAAPPAAPFLH